MFKSIYAYLAIKDNHIVIVDQNKHKFYFKRWI